MPDALILQRFSYRIRKLPILPKLIMLFIRIVYGCRLSPYTKIGTGCYLANGGIAVAIHDRSIIGNNVTIGQCVVLGGSAGHHGVPIVEDDAYIAPGAKVLGPVRIGHGAIVGANAVVTRDVPPHTFVGGVPARIIKENIQPYLQQAEQMKRSSIGRSV